MEKERLLDASSCDPGAVCASWDLGLIVSLMRRIGLQGRQIAISLEFSIKLIY